MPEEKRIPLSPEEQAEIVSRVILFDLPQLDDEHLAVVVAAALRLVEEAI